MYTIENKGDWLEVLFKGDFDYSTIKQIIYDELVRPAYVRTHDLWLVGRHRAHVRLGEIQTIVDEFSRLCPPETCRKKMAIVVEPGLTAAILELLAAGLDRKLPLACRIFHTREAAEHWLDSEASRVA